MALFPTVESPPDLSADYKPFTADYDARFPKGFLHGFATAAPQIEGSISADGKGVSIYDTFSAVPGNVVDNSSTAETANSYTRWEDDIRLLKQFGANSYRFSIAWTRIIPHGGRDDPVNQAGIDHYNKIIDALLAKGITPLVHWDLPQTLEDRYKTLLNPTEFAKDFARYADVCFASFGDRVKLWITHNEPQTTTVLGYALPYLPPRSKSVDQSLIASHSLLLSHAYAVKVYRDKYAEQQGQIGITLCGDWGIPFDDTAESKAVVQKRWDFIWGLFASPIYLTGDYPPIVREHYKDRLPTFTKEEQELLLGSSDFFGYNCYRYMVITDGGGIEPQGFTTAKWEKDGKEFGWPIGSNGWRGHPEGVRDIAVHLSKVYNKPLYNTEFGFSNHNKGTMEETLDDHLRLDYVRDHFEGLRQAAKLGADIRGVFQWALVDTWEWCFGEIWRFGASHVDTKTFDRTPKKAALALATYFNDKIAE